MYYVIFLCTVLYAKKWCSTFFEVSVSQWYLWFPEWIFFSSLTVVRIKTRSQILVKLNMLLSETLFSLTWRIYVLYISISQQTICHWINLQLLHCLTLHQMQDQYCTVFQKLVHCQSSYYWQHHSSFIVILLLLFLSHLQKYCPEDWFFLFQLWNNNHWFFFFIYFYILGIGDHKENAFFQLIILIT